MTFVRRLGEAAGPGGGECRPCHDFASYTLAFALQLRKNHGKPSFKSDGNIWQLIKCDETFHTYVFVFHYISGIDLPLLS